MENNKMKTRYLSALPVLALILFMTSCLPDTPPDNAPQTVEYVDVERYAGTWYEIASYPQIFEFGCNCVTATYGLLDNGNISVFNQCTRFFPGGPENNIQGEASVVPESGNAKLNVTFFGEPPAEGIGNYWIIGLADDYSWAMVSDPYRNTFWILSRTPTISDELYEDLLSRAEEQGYLRNRIQLMNQGCE